MHNHEHGVDTGVIPVVVDDREPMSGVVGRLRERPDVAVSVRRLAAGDYLVDGRLLAERKTLTDFGLSIRDGRLFRQAQRLRGCGVERVCVVLEGTSWCLPEIGLSRAALQGALISVTLCFGLPLLRSQSPAETAELLLIAAKQLRFPSARHLKRRVSRRDSLERSQNLLLQSVPDVGPAKAAALLREFGSPAGVVAASVGELRRVRGIGPLAAERLWRVLHVTNLGEKEF